MIISIIIFKFYCVCVYVHMWIYAHEFSCLGSSENCVGSQGAGVRYSYEPPDMGSGNQIWVLYIYGIKIWSGIFSTHRQSDRQTDRLTDTHHFLSPSVVFHRPSILLLASHHKRVGVILWVHSLPPTASHMVFFPESPVSRLCLWEEL